MALNRKNPPTFDTMVYYFGRSDVKADRTQTMLNKYGDYQVQWYRPRDPQDDKETHDEVFIAVYDFRDVPLYAEWFYVEELDNKWVSIHTYGNKPNDPQNPRPCQCNTEDKKK